MDDEPHCVPLLGVSLFKVNQSILGSIYKKNVTKNNRNNIFYDWMNVPILFFVSRLECR